MSGLSKSPNDTSSASNRICEKSISAGTPEDIKGTPLISVVTVVFNGEELLEKTIQSVARQTYKNVEYVIIDGGSTDKTVDIIKKYGDVVDYWVSESDAGIYNAMNKGLKVFSGDYVNFLNVGDKFCNKYVLAEIFWDVGSGIDIVYGDHIAVDGNKKRYKKSILFTRGNLIKAGTKVINHQSMFVHRRVLVDYSEKYSIKGDLKWYFEMLNKSPDMNVLQRNMPVAYYDKHGLSERNKIVNLVEFIRVIYSEAGVLGVAKSYIVIIKSILQIIIR